jgi:hypothetical protein
VRQPGQRLLPGRRGKPVPAVGPGPGREVVVIGGQKAALTSQGAGYLIGGFNDWSPSAYREKRIGEEARCRR